MLSIFLSVNILNGPFGKLKIDADSHEVFIDNNEIILTALEFKLLKHLWISFQKIMLENYCSNLLESRKKHKLTKYKRMESMTNQLSEKASMRKRLEL